MENKDNSLNESLFGFDSEPVSNISTTPNNESMNINPNLSSNFNNTFAMSQNSYNNDLVNINPNPANSNPYNTGQNIVNEANNINQNSYYNNIYNQNSQNISYNTNQNTVNSAYDMNQSFANNVANNYNANNQMSPGNSIGNNQYISAAPNNVNNYYGNNPPINNPVQNPFDADRKAKAHKLCIISLILYLFPKTIGAFILFLANDNSTLFDLLCFPIAIMPIAAYVLMIICRINYPENKFGKVLMWIYIILFALALIGIALVIFFMVALCNSCPD